MGFKLAELFVDIVGNQKPLSNTLANVHAKLGQAGNALASTLTTGAMVGGAGIVAGLGYGIKKAVELQDTMSRNSVVFGDSASLIESQAQELADKFGVVKGEFMDAAGSFGAMFKGAGSSQKDAAILGNQLAVLAVDMRSFKGGATSTAETMTALGAAMRGEFDPIERFNVFLTAEKVGLEAVAMGLAKNKSELSDHAKKQATLSLIMKGTTDQQGDLARTSGQTGNQYEKLMGTLTNFSAMVGEKLLPAINEWLIALNDKLGPALDVAGFIVRNFGSIWQVAQLQITERIANIIEWVGVIPANLRQVASYITGNWRELIVDAVGAVGTVFSNLADNLGDLAVAIYDFLADPTKGFDFQWTPLLDGLKVTAAKLPEIIRPELTSMQDEIDKILGGVGLSELQRTQVKEQARNAMAGARMDGGASLAAGNNGAKTETIGAAEFWKDLIGKDTGKQQLDVQKQQLDIQKKQLEQLNKTVPLGRLLAMAAP